MAASLAITAIAISGSNVDLDLDTPDDYIVMGDGAFHTAGITVYTRKSGGGSLITLGLYGSTPAAYTYNDSARLINATGGSPVGTVSGWPSGIYDGTNDGGSSNANGGLTVTVPASTTKRRLRVYLGTWATRVTVGASLSDSSASPVSNTTTLDMPSGGAGYFEIEYEAASGSQTLLVNVFANLSYGGYSNVTIQAATLKSIGATGVNLVPGADALVLTGYAPTLARTANQSLVPAQDAIALTGFAPTLTRTAHQSLVPGVDTLAITGFAPSVTQSAGLNLVPAPDAVVLTGYVPALAQTANQSLAPGADAVAIIGLVPTVLQASASTALTPDTDAIAVTGYAPSLVQSGQNPYPLGSGGGPAEYFPSQAEIRSRLRGEQLAAWAREEQAITRSLERKSKPKPVAVEARRAPPAAPVAAAPTPEPPKPKTDARAAQRRIEREHRQAAAQEELRELGERLMVEQQRADEARAQQEADEAQERQRKATQRSRNHRAILQALALLDF